MEEKEKTKHGPEQSQSKEENHIHNDTNQTEKVVPMLEAKQLLENMTEERLENEAEAEVKVQNHAKEEGKVGDSQTNSSKKLKQSLKTKVTIPQPFSLATEKRMSREKRGSMDLKDSKNTLAKSASLNYKISAQSLLGAERSYDLRRAYSTSAGTTSLRPKVSTNEHVHKNIEKQNHPKTKDKVQVKEVERKKQVNAKMLATHPKSPLISQQSKPLLKNENCKTEDRDKRVLKKVSSSTKETLSKLFKTTRKSLGTPKEMVKV